MKERQGEKTKNYIPQRTCTVCHNKKPKTDLMRLVVLENDEITWDRFQKMPGRGAYVCPNPNCIRKLRTNGNLQHRFRRKKTICSQTLLTSMIDYVSEVLPRQ